MSRATLTSIGATITVLLFIVLPLAWKWSCWSAGQKFRTEIAAAEKDRASRRFEEAKGHLQAARDQIGVFGVPPDSLQQVLYGEGQLYMEMGQPADAEKTIREALALVTSDPDRNRFDAECHFLLGMSLALQKKYDESRTEFETSYAVMQKESAHERASLVAQWISEICLLLSENQEAQRYAEAACEYARKSANSPQGRAVLGARKDQLGRVYQAQGRYAAAADEYAEALKLLGQGVPPDAGMQQKVLHDYFYVLEVLEQPTLIAELEERYKVKWVAKETRPTDNPALKYTLGNNPADPPVLLLDKRINLEAKKQTEFAVECEHSGAVRLQFQLELLDRTKVGPSSPVGKVLGDAAVTLHHQAENGPAADWTLKEEKHVTFAEAFDWTAPAGLSRIRVSFATPEVSFDIRVRLMTRAMP